MRTIKARIGVAVAPDGNWLAEGWATVASEEDYRDDVSRACFEGLESDVESGWQLHWIEVELPVPSTEVLLGSLVSTEPLP